MQRRPRDRKAQIARVSADAFSELGYHAVSMEEIASRVGISAAALYRHSPSKYDLFRDAVLALGQQLVDCTEPPEPELPAPPPRRTALAQGRERAAGQRASRCRGVTGRGFG
mgnify:CR=1 FL=1